MEGGGALNDMQRKRRLTENHHRNFIAPPSKCSDSLAEAADSQAGPLALGRHFPGFLFEVSRNDGKH
jgi:hypothetical protein